MAKNTTILLEDNFQTFINGQLQTGKFSSASEVVHAALRLFEQEETKKEVPVAPVDENMYLDEVFNDDEFYANEHVDIDEVPAKIEVAQEDNKAIECDSDDIKRGQDVLSSAYLNNYSTEAKFDVVSCKRMLNPS